MRLAAPCTGGLCSSSASVQLLISAHHRLNRTNVARIEARKGRKPEGRNSNTYFYQPAAETETGIDEVHSFDGLEKW